MKNKMNKYLFLIFFAFPGLFVNSQEKEAAQPLELPRAVIVGSAQFNVKAGVKQMPEKPDALSFMELDSLNSLDKAQSLLLPVEPLNQQIFSESLFYPGFLRAEYGSTNNLVAAAGYQFGVGLFDFYGEAGLDLQADHVPGSAYQKYNLNIYNDYIAPSKFWIFGGSLTRTSLDLDVFNYKNYASLDPYGRQMYDFGAKISSEGFFEGFNFNVGGGYHTLQMVSDSANGFDNSINGYLDISKRFNNIKMGAEVSIDLHSLRGSAVTFTQAMAHASYDVNLISLKVQGGLQTATTSAEINRSGFLLAGNLRFMMNRWLTISGGISTGLEKDMFTEYFRQNPFLAFDSPLDYTYNILNAKGFIHFHPTVNFNFSGGVKFRQSNRYPVYVPAGYDSLFTLNYIDATIAQAVVEGSISFTDSDDLIFNVEYTIPDVNDSEEDIPYIPAEKASAEYHRKWTEKIGTYFGLTYIGERTGNLEGNILVPSYLLLNMGGSYRINDKFKAFLNFENLTNSDIFIWNGYKERGIFVSAGVLFQF